MLTARYRAEVANGPITFSHIVWQILRRADPNRRVHVIGMSVCMILLEPKSFALLRRQSRMSNILVQFVSTCCGNAYTDASLNVRQI